MGERESEGKGEKGREKLELRGVRLLGKQVLSTHSKRSRSRAPTRAFWPRSGSSYYEPDYS